MAHPVGPNRSVRIRAGSAPAASASRLAVSTKPFDPQMKVVARPGSAAAISAASMRPLWPSSPPAARA